MALEQNGTYVLSGASMGIGAALAVALAPRVGGLVLNARSKDKLEATAEAVRAAGLDAVAAEPGDITALGVAETCADAGTALGDLAGFIHVAGLLYPGPSVWELDPAEFDAVIGASVTGAHRLARAVYPHLLRRGRGLAVFFGSGAAQITQPGIGAYCAAKACEEHLARQLAAEAPQILAFAYRPGVVETRMQVDARAAEGGQAEQLREVFTGFKEKGHLISTEDSAAGLLHLLETRSRDELHGQVVRIAGH